MSDWLEGRGITKGPSPEPVREPRTAPNETFWRQYDSIAAAGMIRLDNLAGPQEVMEAAGFTNRGSLAYALRERDFPQPVKVLRGIRLWDIAAVQAWRTRTERNHAGNEE